MTKYKHLEIDHKKSLLDALKQMDDHYVKLLLVSKDGKYAGLLSIGDIQRSFLRNQTFEASVSDAQRPVQRVANSSMTSEAIKQMVLELRTEFMPVLDAQNQLVDIVFWNDLFEVDVNTTSSSELLGTKVIIMAGGKGTRLKPITNIIPKPLIPLGEKPIVERIMDSFNKYGCEEFHLSVNYKQEMIKAFFDKKKDLKYSISYFTENKPLGTAGSLTIVKDLIDSTFIVTNCDILIEDDYSEIMKYHKESGSELTLVSAVKYFNIPYGTLEVDDKGYLEKMTEKPNYTILVNAGFYILEPHLLNEIPESTFYHITYLIEKLYSEGRKVGVFPVKESSWLDIGEWSQYQSSLKRFGAEISF